MYNRYEVIELLIRQMSQNGTKIKWKPNFEYNVRNKDPNLDYFKGQGEIDFDDFCVLMQRMSGDGGDADEYDETRETFKAFDKSGNEKIAVSDLKSVLEGLTVKLTTDELNGILEEMESVGTELEYSGI